MTLEKQQLDKIIELYNSGIEENINIALETANSIFGISKNELDYMSRIRSENLIVCHFDIDETYANIHGNNYLINKESTIKIKHMGDLPECLKAILKVKK